MRSGRYRGTKFQIVDYRYRVPYAPRSTWSSVIGTRARERSTNSVRIFLLLEEEYEKYGSVVLVEARPCEVSTKDPWTPLSLSTLSLSPSTLRGCPASLKRSVSVTTLLLVGPPQLHRDL
eukprot:32190-Rhodomonas_salina.1